MKRKILAVASGGGHWVQLLRLRPAFEGADVEFLSTNAAYAKDVGGKLYAVTDANMWNKLALLKMFVEVAWVMLKVRPDVVVTTGAAPGFAAIFFGRFLGARTVWIDSIANSEELSNSGKQARRWASAWVTQWQHLSKADGPAFWGAVL
ncbi:MAG: UDP-N-acetylglucosamine--LPS N-acetylglucosamine transferase [Azonexaceae bacterium]|nr:UDP-N-acetylglucosamine--LPS N-acetylglucosamine transferase [Azonexaceae bacterium]